MALIRQHLPSTLSELLLQQYHQQAATAAVAFRICGYSAAAVPQLEEDELVLKASNALEEIKAAGTLKVERQITTPQSATVGRTQHRLRRGRGGSFMLATMSVCVNGLDVRKYIPHALWHTMQIGPGV